MQTLTEIKSLLAERGIKPKHRLGQNFLHDHNQLKKIVEAAHLKSGDVVLEVGPGTGALTEALLEKGTEVIACEIDPDMQAILEDRLGDKITLIKNDCLESKHAISTELISAIGVREFKLVANLPYNAASPLMMNLLISHPNCVGQFVTIQKEVANRLIAKPSTKEYGPLTIVAQTFADVKKISTLSAGCFWPKPEVTSAMVALIPHPLKGVDKVVGSKFFPTVSQRQTFSRFVTVLFTKRRKQLGSIFGRESKLPDGITPDLRPDVLQVEQMVELWYLHDSLSHQ